MPWHDTLAIIIFCRGANGYREIGPILLTWLEDVSRRKGALIDAPLSAVLRRHHGNS
jgi:hypothetical protein